MLPLLLIAVLSSAEHHGDTKPADEPDADRAALAADAHPVAMTFRLNPTFFAARTDLIWYTGFGLQVGWRPVAWFAVDAIATIPKLVQPHFDDRVGELYDEATYQATALRIKYFEFYAAAGPRLYPFTVEPPNTNAALDFFVQAGVGAVLLLESCVPLRDECSDDAGFGQGFRAPPRSTRTAAAYDYGAGVQLRLPPVINIELAVRQFHYHDTIISPGEVIEEWQRVLVFALSAGVML